MSNSIWHKPEEKPKGFSFILEHHKAYDFDLHKDVAAYNIFETGGNPQNPFDEDTIRWCHLDELLAQADKAERLQKAVDLAQERLLSISDGYDIMKADAETIKLLFYAIQDEASETYKEIKQLIKENQ